MSNFFTLRRSPATQPATQPIPEEPAPVVQTPKPPREVREPSKVAKAVDPPALVRPIVNLSIYQISLPLNSLSRNELFWKRVDETILPVKTHEILWKNGLRAGIAPLSDFEYFDKLLDRNPVQLKPLTLIAPNVKIAELAMKQALPEQTIYHFNLDNELVLRTFDDADNNFIVEFQSLPRKPHHVRIGLCPMVRSLRQKLVAIGDADNREIEIRRPEKFFDINLKVDLPLDSFLIVGLSPEGLSRMSLGHSFLVQEGETQKSEEVLLIIPQAILPKKKPTPPGSPGSQPPHPAPAQ